MSWRSDEEEKYSRLYQNGYPAGRPFKCVKYFDIDLADTLIDLGCGPGEWSKQAKQYTGIDISSYVIEQNKLKNSGTYYQSCLTDLDGLTGEHFVNGVCFDVMEHIPPEHIFPTLKSISSLDIGTWYFAICTRKSKKLDQDGNNLHLTIRSDEWWQKRLSDFFEIETCKPWKDLVMCQCTNYKSLLLVRSG